MMNASIFLVRKMSETDISLRSLAKSAAISPALLSQFLNHKRGISRKTALKLSRQLSFSDREVDHFVDLVDASFA
jgi:plasmid maintenance system antidote protein VapI